MNRALFTDLYEITMAAGYFANRVEGVATFELSVRSLPEERNFLVACGLDRVLEYLEGLHFDGEAIAYLRSLGFLPDAFLDHLAGFRFTGDVRAVPEGEVVFGQEPIVEITAAVIESQIVETFVINQIAAATMIASKAARVASACGDRSFVDFSARRDHGLDAAMIAARAAVIAGANGTSLVEAGRRWGLQLSGTMAHSFVMSFADERDAFRSYARTFPNGAILLLDTYDTIRGAHHAAEVAEELAAEGITIYGVRLDSGDLAALAKEVRAILDRAGFPGIRVLASGDLDEYRIASVLEKGAPIDAFGVGTRMGTSIDAPTLGAVYKLVEDGDGPKLKLSSGKATLPGRKQVWRADSHDVIALEGEQVGHGRPLMELVMQGGVRVQPEPAVAELQARCRAAVAALPARLRSLIPADPGYDVRISDGLQSLVERLTSEHAP